MLLLKVDITRGFVPLHLLPQNIYNEKNESGFLPSFSNQLYQIIFLMQLQFNHMNPLPIGG